MAYLTNDQMKAFRAAIKSEFPTREGWKFSVRKVHHSKLSISMMQYPNGYNFGTEYQQINHYYIDRAGFGEKETNVLNRLNQIAHIGHWDKSDLQTDYFHCSHYISLSIGKWNMPATTV